MLWPVAPQLHGLCHAHKLDTYQVYHQISESRNLGWEVQVQPFRTVRKSQSAAEERHSSLKEVAKYDIRHMRAAFSGSLPIVNDSDIDPTQAVSPLHAFNL